MSVDYPGAIDMMVPLSYSYSSNAHLKIVEHCTGGDLTLQAIYNTFMATMRSTHFGIDANGNVAQFVPLARGAGGNCCIEPGCDPIWVTLKNIYGNLNLCTISIEHCNNGSQSLPMTAAQLQASEKLNLWLCKRYKLKASDISYHSSIDPATNCPGSLFLQNSLPAIKSYVIQGLQGGHMEQQFETIWMSGAGINPDGTQWKTSGTNIHDACLRAFLARNMKAPCHPTSNEIQSVDTAGDAILVQTLSNGCFAVKWVASQHISIYDSGNNRIYG